MLIRYSAVLFYGILLAIASLARTPFQRRQVSAHSMPQSLSSRCKSQPRRTAQKSLLDGATVPVPVPSDPANITSIQSCLFTSHSTCQKVLSSNRTRLLPTNAARSALYTSNQPRHRDSRKPRKEARIAYTGRDSSMALASIVLVILVYC
ncbi:hypothetical protein BCR37DRAFT_381275 [Protomyces lactucae-debilis]|uniref:Uncharacterized protein n=1 Tax=Protomyces lactucae-debilis TaxID=2754530 RepID=A0A1Y2F8Q1_PROLT|nr:uncharacterized protein BCR37DRAFT_381275 [Protomyces lactucae-debilis]ORY79834.1 hypothetical protein BCR37DRAFT_381275 [Protomyces lactucae-debilis]